METHYVPYPGILKKNPSKNTQLTPIEVIYRVGFRVRISVGIRVRVIITNLYTLILTLTPTCLRRQFLLFVLTWG